MPQDALHTQDKVSTDLRSFLCNAPGVSRPLFGNIIVQRMHLPPHWHDGALQVQRHACSSSALERLYEAWFTIQPNSHRVHKLVANSDVYRGLKQ